MCRTEHCHPSIKLTRISRCCVVEGITILPLHCKHKKLRKQSAPEKSKLLWGPLALHIQPLRILDRLNRPHDHLHPDHQEVDLDPYLLLMVIAEQLVHGVDEKELF